MEYDYTGEMGVYQNQLADAGISKEQFDMDNYVGLTARQLQGVVNSVLAQWKKRKQVTA